MDTAGPGPLGVTLALGANDSGLLQAAADLGARGRCAPRIAQVLVLEDAARARATAEAGSSRGEPVLTIT